MLLLCVARALFLLLLDFVVGFVLPLFRAAKTLSAAHQKVFFTFVQTIQRES